MVIKDVWSLPRISSKSSDLTVIDDVWTLQGMTMMQGHWYWEVVVTKSSGSRSGDANCPWQWKREGRWRILGEPAWQTEVSSNEKEL